MSEVDARNPAPLWMKLLIWGGVALVGVAVFLGFCRCFLRGGWLERLLVQNAVNQILLFQLLSAGYAKFFRNFLEFRNFFCVQFNDVVHPVCV